MELKTSGIIFISFTWSIILSLIIFCFYKVFKTEKKK